MNKKRLNHNKMELDMLVKEHKITEDAEKEYENSKYQDVKEVGL